MSMYAIDYTANAQATRQIRSGSTVVQQHPWVCPDSTTSCYSYFQLSTRILTFRSLHITHHTKFEIGVTLSNAAKHALDTDLCIYPVLLCPVPACLTFKESLNLWFAAVLRCTARLRV